MILGVDACNTALGVLIFAAAMNLGQTWATVLTLFGCMFWFPSRTGFMIYTDTISNHDLLCSDLG